MGAFGFSVVIIGGDQLISRLTVAVILVILIGLATSAVASAAGNSDRNEVIAGTALVCLGVVLLVSIAYVAKLVFGLEKQLAAPDADDDNGGSH